MHLEDDAVRGPVQDVQHLIELPRAAVPLKFQERYRVTRIGDLPFEPPRPCATVERTDPYKGPVRFPIEPGELPQSIRDFVKRHTKW